MNPYFLTNILLSCLIAFKVLILAFNRTEINPTDFVVLLMAVGVFYMGIITIAEYLTGQFACVCLRSTVLQWDVQWGVQWGVQLIFLPLKSLSYQSVSLLYRLRRRST